MSSASAIQLLVLMAVLTIVSIRWQRALLLALPFLVVLNGLPLGIAGFTVRLDQLAACALCIPLVVGVVAKRRAFHADRATWFLAGILLSNVVASALNSPATAYSFAQCANLATAWVIYIVVINFAESPEDCSALLQRFLVAALLATTAASLAFLAATAGLSIGGADVSATAAENLVRPFGAYGTMLEPNILGSFSAASLVLSAGLLSQRAVFANGSQRRLALATAASSAVALLLSFTRSAWLGAILGLVLVGILARGTGSLRLRRVVVPIGAVVLVAAAILLTSGTASDFLRYKILNLVNPESPTVVLRILTYTLALQQTAAHPIVGWGTFTFAPLVAQGADFAQFAGWKSIWIPNFLLLALHDTGVIGLALWIGLLGSLVVPGWKSARAARGEGDAEAATRGALTAALVTLLLPFLATTGFSLGYPWLLAGMLGARARWMHRDPS